MKSLIVIVTLALLGGCAGYGKAVKTTALGIGGVADATLELCGNTVPDGPCAVGASISTTRKNQIKASLTDALDALETSTLLYFTDQRNEAKSKLERAEAILVLLLQELEE